MYINYDVCKQPENKLKNVKVELANNQLFLTIDLDKTEFKREIEDRCKKEVVEELKNEIRRAIFKQTYLSRYSSSNDEPAPWLVEAVKEQMNELQPELIEASARILADRMHRSRIVRERFADILDKELNTPL